MSASPIALPTDAPDVSYAECCELVQGTINHSYRLADLAAPYIRSLIERGVMPPADADGTCSLTRAELLELAAVAQLQAWEREGFAEFLPDDIPSAVEAEQAFLDHLAKSDDPGERGLPLSDLNFRLFQVWLALFPAHARRDLGVDVVLVPGHPEEQHLDTLAEFLWQFRHLASTTEDEHAAT